MKTCSKCNLEKEDDCFSKNRRSCKSCYSLYYKEYYKLNKEKLQVADKLYYQNNKKQFAKKQKEYIVANKEKVSSKKKEYYIANKELIIKRQNETEKLRRKTDLSFKLKKNISSQIRYNLTKFKSSKDSKSCVKYLPFLLTELKDHLEKQFELWMNWNNWGKYDSKLWDDNDSSTWTWQLDHIIPQADLPYSSMEDENFKKCWSLENLRPYSAKQNFLDGIYRVRHISKCDPVKNSAFS